MGLVWKATSLVLGVKGGCHHVGSGPAHALEQENPRRLQRRRGFWDVSVAVWALVLPDPSQRIAGEGGFMLCISALQPHLLFSGIQKQTSEEVD